MGDLAKVDFRGDTIWTERRDDGTVGVAVKPIIERLGLDWSSQLQRLRRDELLSEGVGVTTIPSPGGPQETVTLPLELLPGFLFGISTERILDPEAKARVLAYKRDCHAVLFRHFFGQPVDPAAGWDWQEIDAKVRLVKAARLAHGKAVAAALWVEIGLPLAADPARSVEPPTTGLDFVRALLAARTEPAGFNDVVPVAQLHAAYSEWARAQDAPPMAASGLGMALSRLGYRKHHGAQSRGVRGRRLLAATMVAGVTP